MKGGLNKILRNVVATGAKNDFDKVISYCDSSEVN